MRSKTVVRVRVLNVLVLLLMVFTSLCEGEVYCYVKAPSWTNNSQVHLSLFASLRMATADGGCGEISPESLQSYVAVAWVIEKLNQGEGFIPGIKFNFELHDDCQNPVYTAGNIKAVLSPSHCNESKTSLHLGIIGPSTSETATEAAKLLKSSHLPLISPSAILTDLGDQNHYPNFFRTSLPDTVQVRLILTVLLELDWTYVALVYSDDVNGRTAAEMLRTEGKTVGVCFIDSYAVSQDTDRDQLFTDLKTIRDRTQDGTLGVVYFGKWDILLMSHYKTNNDRKMHWIMSDSVGELHDKFVSQGSATAGTLMLTVSPVAVILDGIKNFWYDIMTTNEIMKTYISQEGNKNLMNTSQSTSVFAVVDATYAYAVVLKKLKKDTCPGVNGVCETLVKKIYSREFLQYIKEVRVNYLSLDQSYVLKEYAQEKRYFYFNKTTNVREPISVMYQIKAFKDHQNFIPVGNYTQHGLTLDKMAIQMIIGESLPKSLCKGYCKACVDFGQVPMVHVPGDVYIVGVFSLHEFDDDNPFRCTAFRNVSSDTIALEAFIFAVKELRNLTGITFGVIAFDDCYSSIRLTTIMSEYFSSIGTSAVFSKPGVPQNKTVAVVGALSSGSTIPLARFFNSLNIPVISYAASSPDLDDRVNFPNFLRTVPSDVEQARAMVAIIKSMEWEYVSLLYVSNNYGTKGMLVFKKLATEAGICVAKEKPISELPENDDIPSLGVVLMDLINERAKVVVFGGLILALKLLSML